MSRKQKVMYKEERYKKIKQHRKNEFTSLMLDVRLERHIRNYSVHNIRRQTDRQTAKQSAKNTKIHKEYFVALYERENCSIRFSP